MEIISEGANTALTKMGEADALLRIRIAVYGEIQRRPLELI